MKIPFFYILYITIIFFIAIIINLCCSDVGLINHSQNIKTQYPKKSFISKSRVLTFETRIRDLNVYNTTTFSCSKLWGKLKWKPQIVRLTTKRSTRRPWYRSTFLISAPFIAQNRWICYFRTINRIIQFLLGNVSFLGYESRKHNNFCYILRIILFYVQTFLTKVLSG